MSLFITNTFYTSIHLYLIDGQMANSYQPHLQLNSSNVGKAKIFQYQACLEL